MLDYRGYGKSSGRPSEQGLYRDSEAGFIYLLGKGYRARADYFAWRVIGNRGGHRSGIAASLRGVDPGSSVHFGERCCGHRGSVHRTAADAKLQLASQDSLDSRARSFSCKAIAMK